MHQMESGANWARLLEIESHEKDLVMVIGSFPGQKIQIASDQKASGTATPNNAKGSPTHFWARSDASKVHFEYINPGNVLLARLAPADHKSRVRVFVGTTPSADLTNKQSWIAYPEKDGTKNSNGLKRSRLSGNLIQLKAASSRNNSHSLKTTRGVVRSDLQPWLFMKMALCL